MILDTSPVLCYLGKYSVRISNDTQLSFFWGGGQFLVQSLLSCLLSFPVPVSQSLLLSINCSAFDFVHLLHLGPPASVTLTALLYLL